MTMHALLNDTPDIRIVQHSGRIVAKQLAAVDQLLLILPERVPASAWRSLPQGAKLKSALRKRERSATPALVTRLTNSRQTLVLGATVAAGASAFDLLVLGRKLAAAASGESGTTLAVAAVGFASGDQARITGHVLAAVLAAGFAMPAYKQQTSRPRWRSVRLLGLDEHLDTARIEAEAQGNNLARWLTTMPPNKLDAANYSDIVRTLAKEQGWECKRYSMADLKKLGAGAFLAVAQGNGDDSACILHLRYRPGAKTAGPDLALVGKGIVFDTGGTNLKPFQSMLDMHGDMQGSAVALGTLLAITQLKLPLAVDGWLAVTENRIGPQAYKSRDVVTAANGKTIQTIHTDAEGRMVLADTLVLASREEPRLIVDYATLTGACIGAITKRYSGVFTNRPDWHPRLKRTGQVSGERVWPFPMGDEFLDELKSEVADLKQCSVQGTGDHILAATFLAQFVGKDIPWVHLDLSSGDIDGGLGHIATKVTGFGVRYTLSLLLDENLQESTR
jgi:leucyl aminopeptidase